LLLRVTMCQDEDVKMNRDVVVVLGARRR